MAGFSGMTSPLNSETTLESSSLAVRSSENMSDLMSVPFSRLSSESSEMDCSGPAVIGVATSLSLRGPARSVTRTFLAWLRASALLLRLS